MAPFGQAISFKVFPQPADATGIKRVCCVEKKRNNGVGNPMPSQASSLLQAVKTVVQKIVEKVEDVKAKNAAITQAVQSDTSGAAAANALNPKAKTTQGTENDDAIY